MLKSELAKVMDQVITEINFLRDSGHKEYAGGENAFGNFERLATQLDLKREKVLWVYLMKHIDGVVSYLNGHVSQREPIEGRINDIIVYLILLRGMVQENSQINKNSIIAQPGKIYNNQEVGIGPNLKKIYETNKEK